MTEDEKELQRLIQAEREACKRSERLTSPRSTMTNSVIREAARKICEDTKEAVRGFLRAHPGLLKTRNFNGPR